MAVSVDSTLLAAMNSRARSSFSVGFDRNDVFAAWVLKQNSLPSLSFQVTEQSVMTC